MTDEIRTPENEMVALGIGRAILNAQVMADQILTDARRRADEIARSVVATSVGASRKPGANWVEAEEAIAMLHELDEAELQLRDCQSELIAFLDQCLGAGSGGESVSRPGVVDTGHPGPPSRAPHPSAEFRQHRPPDEPQADRSEEAAPEVRVVEEPIDYQSFRQESGSGEAITGDATGHVSEPMEGSEHDRVSDSQPQARSHDDVGSGEPSQEPWTAFWGRSKEPWNPAELETFRKLNSESQRSDFEAHDLNRAEAPSDIVLRARVLGDWLPEPHADEEVVGNSGDLHQELVQGAPRDAQSAPQWAPPSGSPVQVPAELNPPEPLELEQMTTDEGASLSGEHGNQGFFRRAAALPNMLALAGTLVVLLILLIVVQTV